MRVSTFARAAAVLALHATLLCPVACPQARAEAPAATPAGVPAGATSSRAEALFDQGKARLAANDLEGASTAFAESYRLEPATGTLLALAMCHEGRHLLVSALRAYSEVAERAAKEGRKDRESAARGKVADLTPQVSSVTLEPLAPLAGVSLWLDDTQLAAEQVGKALPVDGGEHVIDARREQEVVWSTRVSVASSSDSTRVLVPRLEPETPPPAVAQREAASEAPVEQARPLRATPSDEHWPTTGQWAGLITLGTAVISFGVATGFAISASSQNDASARGCDGDLCTAKARQQRLDARSAGDVATFAVFSGAALATVGAVLYFAHPPSTQAIDAASTTTLRGWASRDGAGASVQGGF